MDNLWAINDKFVWLHAVVKAACCHSWNSSNSRYIGTTKEASLVQE